VGQHKLPGGITGKGFRPGASGNPSGRPRTSLRAILRAMLDATEIPSPRGDPVQLPDGLTLAHLVIQGLIKSAAKGDVKAIQAIFRLVEPDDAPTAPDCREALLSEAEAAVSAKRNRD
jgi:hypothetical protein